MHTDWFNSYSNASAGFDDYKSKIEAVIAHIESKSQYPQYDADGLTWKEKKGELLNAIADMN